MADGYDRMAERYFAWSDARPSATRLAMLDLALATIPSGSDVVELGCGTGRNAARVVDPGAASYWIVRDPPGPPPRSMSDQF